MAMAALVVGLCQVLSGLHLWRLHGQITALAMAISGVELLWVCTAVYYLFTAVEPAANITALALLFLVYVGYSLFRSSDYFKELDPESESLPTLPPVLVFTQLGFGTVYSGIALITVITGAL